MKDNFPKSSYEDIVKVLLEKNPSMEIIYTKNNFAAYIRKKKSFDRLRT